MTSPAGVTATRDSAGSQAGLARSSSISLASGTGLARRPARGERGGRDGADDVGVARGLASDQHAVTMTRRRPGAQPDFAVIPVRRPEVRITRLAEGVFYAVAIVEAPGGAVEVGARPSDAVNLAVLSGCADPGRCRHPG